MAIVPSINSSAVLIDKYINTSYDVVKLVHDNLDAISVLGNNIPMLAQLNEYANNIITVGNSIDAINAAVDSLPNIFTLIESIPKALTYTTSDLLITGAYADVITGSVTTGTLFIYKDPINISTFNSINIFVNGNYLHSNEDYTVDTHVFYEGAYRTVIKFKELLVETDLITLIIGVLTPEPVISIVNRTKQALSVQVPHAGVTVGGGTTVVDLNAIGGFTYTQLENQLMVIVNGVFQSLASGAFEETTSSIITLTGELNSGDTIDVYKVN